MSTGKTMPVTRPKAPRGSAVASASRLGTIRFSRVLRPPLQVSAIARGRAARRIRRPMGMEASTGFLSRRYRSPSRLRVSRLPMALPKITLRQARSGSDPAQRARQRTVTPMENICSPISTAASTPMRFSPVKYPVSRAQRQVMGKKQENSRKAPMIAVLPIQFRAMAGAKTHRSPPTAAEHTRL